MTVQLIPSIETILYSYLEDHPDLVTLGARVAGSLPSEQSEQVAPWVRVTQLDATDVGGIEHFIDYLVQLDCYADVVSQRAHTGQAAATLLARTVRAVLKTLQGETVDGVVVSSVRFQGMIRQPDTDFKPARERFVLTAAIHCHAA